MMNAKLSTDNIALMAVLALDVRPSSVCVLVSGFGKYTIEVLRHETIGRPFASYVVRFKEVLSKAFAGTQLGEINLEVVVVDQLTFAFKEQLTWNLMTGIKVGN